MWVKELDKRLKKLKIFYKENESLAPYTTIKIGGTCLRMIFPDKEEKLIEILNFLQNEQIEYFIMGGGSKLLAGDSDFNGVVVNLKKMRGIEIMEENENKIYLKVKAGTKINELTSLGLNKGFLGIEFLGGIPATVGGAIKMNAGAFGKSVSEFAKNIKIYKNGEIKKINAHQNLWGYRVFKEDGIILSCIFEFIKIDKEKIKTILLENLKKRKRTQPIFEKTFGSVFKNPYPLFAGQLIEACGLKGYRIGSAKISEKHANFIINLGGAKAGDVITLIKVAQEKVFSKFGILLEPEVKFLGCSL